MHAALSGRGSCPKARLVAIARKSIVINDLAG